MTPALRILLVIGSFVTLIAILRGIRRAQVQIRDSIFWILMAIALLVLSLFPRIAIFFSRSLGIASPINFVYLLVIFLLLAHQFSMSLRLSQTDAKLRRLAQEVALSQAETPPTSTAPATTSADAAEAP